jgi:hypothetical protein
MLVIFGYLAAAAALFAGAALGLMVLVGESADLGKNLGAYTTAGSTARARPMRNGAADLNGSAASTTTGQAAKSDPPAAKQVRPKPPKVHSVRIDKRKKRPTHAARDRR